MCIRLTSVEYVDSEELVTMEMPKKEEMAGCVQETIDVGKSECVAGMLKPALGLLLDVGTIALVSSKEIL